MNLFALSGLLVFDQIEPLSRTGHARRREVVVNGCRAGSGATRNALRVVLDPYDVSARSRCVKRHGHRAGRGVLRDRVRCTLLQLELNTLFPLAKANLPVKLSRRDRLSDRERLLLPAGTVTDTQ